MLSMLIILSLLGLILYNSSFIMTLLYLEVMVVMILYLFMLMIMLNDYLIFFYLMVFGVCEGALGLSVLVSMLRSVGNDNMSNMFLQSC